MIHRHPHVFGQTSVHTVEDVHQNWEALKQMEKGKKERQSVLDGVAKSLPSLAKAFHLQKKAAKVGFDWDDVGDIWKKLSEELRDRKSTRLNSSHVSISYAVFCLKKKKDNMKTIQ